MQDPKPKRDYEAQKRYSEKTYQKVSIVFRKDEDADILDLIKDEQAKGYSLREAIRNLIFRDNA